MGRYASSKSHFIVAKRVLQGHLTFIRSSKHGYDAKKIVSLIHKDFGNPKSNGSPKEQEQVDHAPSTTPLRTRRATISRAGLMPEITTDELNSPAKSYLDAYEGDPRLSPGVVRANAKMVHRYSSWAEAHCVNLTDSHSGILSEHAPAEFMEHLRTIFKPNTLKNHAGAMISFLDAALTVRQVRDNLGATSPAIQRRIRRARQVWSQLKNNAEKQAKKQQRVMIRSGQFSNVPMKAFFDFLMENQFKIGNIMELSTNELQPGDVRLVNCYVATILALHGQRLCMALNMTSSQVNGASPLLGANLHIVRVTDHKTRQAFGPAAICLPKSHFDVFKALARYRQTIDGPEARLLQAPPGRAAEILFAPLNAFIRRTIKGCSEIRFNQVRKTLETFSHYDEISAQRDSRSLVSNYLLHGTPVTALYYKFRTDAQVAAESTAVKTVLAHLVVLDMARDGLIPLPKHWSGMDSILINRYSNHTANMLLTNPLSACLQNPSHPLTS